MAKFRKKAVVVEAITFDELVAHGLRCPRVGVVQGMPWSFTYAHHPITHETDDCYLIPTPEGTMKMTREDMLITGVKGEIYPCKINIFEATYDVERDLPEPGQPANVDPFNPPAPLPEYAQRLAEETQQTITRLVNLDGYMCTKTYGELTPLKRSLLYQQRQEMEAYAKTVSLRYCMALLEHR